MAKRYRYLKPSDQDAITWMLDHVEEIRKRIDRSLADVEPDGSAFQTVVTMTYWNTLVTYTCFKMLWKGGFLEDAKLLVRKILEADVRMAFVAQRPEERAKLYLSAAHGEHKRMLSTVKEVQTIVDTQTGTSVAEVGEFIRAAESSLGTLDAESAHALNYWRRLSFKDLCIKTNRSYEYIMYSLCSQVIHGSSVALSGNVKAGKPPDGRESWTLLSTATKSYLSLASTLSGAFGFAEIEAYIAELNDWFSYCDKDWVAKSLTKTIGDLVDSNRSPRDAENERETTT